MSQNSPNTTSQPSITPKTARNPPVSTTPSSTPIYTGASAAITRCCSTVSTRQVPPTMTADNKDIGPAPPIHPPDSVSFFDPASVGGGGPLRRISTQHSIRTEQEAKERAAREAAGLPVDGGILNRIRTGSISRRTRGNTITAKPTFITPLDEHEHEHEHEHENENDNEGKNNHNHHHHHWYNIPQLGKWHHHRPTLTPTVSQGDLTHVGTSSEEKTLEYNKASSTASSSRDSSEKKEEKDIGIVESQVEHVYPDGGYGWVVLICCMTLAGLTMGWGMNWGVFQAYYSTKVFPTESTTYLSAAGQCTPFMSSLIAFVAGKLGDKYGFKRMLILSALTTWLGLFTAGFSTKIWHILLTQGILTGLGQGMAVPLFMSLPSQWFWKKRGLASGLSIGGAGLGGGFSTLMIRPMLDNLGHKKTLIICSFMNLSLTLIATYLIKTRPTCPEAQSKANGPWIDKKTIKSLKLWSIFMSLIVGVIGYAIPYTWVATWVVLRLPELSPIYTAIPVTLMAFSVCVGRALAGIAADKIGPINTFIAIFSLSGAVQLSLWLTANTFAQICVFAVMFGLIAPGFLGLLPQIIVQMFGPANLASNVGLFLLALAPGNFIAGPAGGALYEKTGRTSFTNVILLGGIAQLTGAVLACYARFAVEKKLAARV